MNCLSPISAAKLVGVGLLSAGLLVGCSSKPSQPAESTTPAASAAAEAAANAVTSAPLPKLVSPVRGEARLAYLKPETKKEGNLVVTKIEVKNIAGGPIAGLKISESWWDKDGNPVTGSEDRLKDVLMPGDTATLTLNTPYSPKMDRNNMVFSHANGTIKPVLMEKFPTDTTTPGTGKPQ